MLEHRHDHGPREVFRGTRWDKWLYRSIGPFFSLLLIGGLVNPGSGGTSARVLLAVVIVLALSTTWRGWHLGTIETNSSGLHAYGALHRWTWTWSELDHVELGSGPLPFAPATSNRPLVVHCSDGRVKRLTAINGKAHQPDKPSWLAVAVERINARIHIERRTGGAA